MLNSYNVTLCLNNTKLPQSAPIEQFPVVSVGVHHDSVLQDGTDSGEFHFTRGAWQRTCSRKDFATDTKVKTTFKDNHFNIRLEPPPNAQVKVQGAYRSQDVAGSRSEKSLSKVNKGNCS